MKYVTPLLLILSLTISTSLTAKTIKNKASESQSKQLTISLGESIKFHSEALGEDREIIVHVPDGYEDSNIQYPVLYVLDGEEFLALVTAAVDSMVNEFMPNSIIVAITNAKNTRSRDLGREKDKFLQFIKEEVIPRTERKYRTLPIKILLGHSFAGYFVLSTLASDPKLFDAYIAASPIVEIFDSELLARYETLLKGNYLTDLSLYMSMGGKVSEGKSRIDAYNKLSQLFSDNAPQDFTWTSELMSDQTHGSTVYPSFYKGLQHTFQEFRDVGFIDYSDYKSRGKMAGLVQFYKSRSEKYFTDITIPEWNIAGVAKMLLESEHNKEAIVLFKRNVTNHPKSISAIVNLARAFERIGKNNSAIDLYENTINADIELSLSAIDYLKKQVLRLKSEK
ncbi:MAG: alpha/beta hydrolase [Colwellia sp.]|nr:alpha/beta hydrolase [Colwellia sp.]